MNGRQGMCDTKPGQEGLPSFHHRHHLLESRHIGPWGHSLPQTLPHLPRGQSYQPTKWEAQWKSEWNEWAVGETWRSRAENSHREDRTLKALLWRSDWVVWLNSTVSSFSLRWVKTVHERRQSPPGERVIDEERRSQNEHVHRNGITVNRYSCNRWQTDR